MASNPFDIDALNGLNFDTDAIAKVASGVLVMSQNSTGSYDIEFRGPKYTATTSQKLTVVNSDYTEANSVTQNGFQYYHFASFGAIQFEGDTTTYWVHGFNENGILLSTNQDLLTYAPEGQPITGNYGLVGSDFSSATTFIFGTYGVVDISGVGNPNAIDQQGAIFNKDSSVLVIPNAPCFAEGVLLATPQGECAVESLAAGDLVLTADGAMRAIKWIGETLVRPNRHPRAHQVQPARVRAGAFGTGLPLRDLRLSPGHAVYVDGVLVPVGLLVNGATIVQEEVESIRYFHVELDTHDVLLADGLPCESYLDDGNRTSFANAEGHVALHGRLDPVSWDDACAPLVADGPQLAAIQQTLLTRAETMGWTRTEEGDLVVEADGVAIPAELLGAHRFRFHVPAAEQLVLRSAKGVLAQVMPGMADRRQLGVAISALRIDGETMALDADQFGTGFHAVENHGDTAWRWTNGAAVLALGHHGACTIEIDVAMVAPSWRREAAALRAAA